MTEFATSTTRSRICFSGTRTDPVTNSYKYSSTSTHQTRTSRKGRGVRTKILFWNVQGLRAKIAEISNYINNFQIICLTETWIESKNFVKTEKGLSTKYKWFWIEARREKQRGRAAGGMIIGVAKEMETQKFTGNSKGCWASVEVKIRGEWTKIVSIYNNTSCQSMSSELEECLRGEANGGIILGGDLNARIGPLGALNPDEERESSDLSVDEEGENWIELLDTCEMSILNGNTAGDRLGQITRPGNQNQQESVIDYAAANPEARDIIEEFRVGGEPNSDHFPLELYLNTHMELHKELITQQLWNSATKEEYLQRTRNGGRTHSWNDLQTKLWEATPKRCHETGRARRNEWWTDSCQASRELLRQKLKRTRAGEVNYQEYREQRKEYKKEINKAKEEYRSKCREELTQVKNINDGWKFIKKYQNRRTPGNNNKPSSDDFFEHFRQLLQGQEDRATYMEAHLAEEIVELSRDEFDSGLAALKEKKAAGPDNLKAEALKHADEWSKTLMFNLCKGVMNGGPVPANWCQSTILPIYKKGGENLPANYRGIAVGNAIYKLMAGLVCRRIRDYVEENEVLPDSQNGFRKGRSTVDNIYILNQCIQKTIEKERGKLFALFIDFKTAFDSINRRILVEELAQAEIPPQLIRAVVNLYENTTYLVEGKSFESFRGLKQGCPLSPILFAIYIRRLDRVLRANQLGGIVMGRSKIFSLAFADDIVIMAESAADLKDMIKATQRFACKMEITINTDKTKVLTFSKGAQASKVDWTIEGVKYEEVEFFTYLGVEFQRSGRFTRHHKTIARKANRRTTEVWSLAERLFPDSFAIRTQMFNSLVLPILLYAAEVTGFEMCDQYEVIQRRYFKWTLGLPGGTRDAILACECGLLSVASKAVGRAAKYENWIGRKSSILLAGAYGVMRNGVGHSWKKARESRLRALGWSSRAAEEQFTISDNFWRAVKQRDEDIFRQVSRCKAAKKHWYQMPGQLPQYLATCNANMKTIARFRCGSETRDTESWRGESLCRVCACESENPSHVARCQGTTVEELFHENGNGVALMLEILRKRL